MGKDNDAGFTMEPLTSTNWPEWQLKETAALGRKGMYHWLKNSPVPGDADYATQVKDDTKAKFMLASMCATEYYHIVMDATTGGLTWTALQNHFRLQTYVRLNRAAPG